MQSLSPLNFLRSSIPITLLASLALLQAGVELVNKVLNSLGNYTQVGSANFATGTATFTVQWGNVTLQSVTLTTSSSNVAVSLVFYLFNILIV